MNYRLLGKTGLKISVIGFGGIPIQRGTAEEAAKALVLAKKQGINFIDTARAYTVSEEYIGRAVEKEREDWIIATKSMARSKEDMANDINISLGNLRTDYLDLYQIHNLKTDEELERVLAPDGAYQALLEAQDKGIIRHIGVTAHSLEVLKKALETKKFASIMYPYNIVENQGEEIFARAKELETGVIAMKPLAGGALDEVKLALRFILANENVTTAIPGMGNEKEVEENAAIANNLTALTREETARISELVKELGTKFCRRCGYCGPCPEGIDIPTMFLLQGYKERYNLGQWSEERYKAMPARAKDCVECGTCETKCPYDLPIREMLKKVRLTFPE